MARGPMAWLQRWTGWGPGRVFSFAAGLALAGVSFGVLRHERCIRLGDCGLVPGRLHGAQAWTDLGANPDLAAWTALLVAGGAATFCAWRGRL